MSSTVTLQINSQRLIKNLMFSFTNKTTFLSELMQNARRAGATFVRFSFDEVWPNTLVVEDDGAGIANLQNLLTIAESGWDETIQAQENPFGMGFMSALFAAQRITVHSNGKRLSFDREEALEQKPIIVEDSPKDSQSTDVSTRIELYGIGLTQAEVTSAIETAAQGFAIKVFFNGKECRRPFAWDNLMHNSPSIYDAVLSLPNLGGIAFSTHNTDFEVYLLGIKVYQSQKYKYFGGLSTIIHLDPTLFTARLPDRQCLIDETTAVETIKRVIKSWWAQHIEPQVGVISDEALISKYWTVLTQWDLPDVLTQIKAIPANYFCKYTDTPMCYRSDGDSRNNNMDDLDGKLITEEQLRTGEFIACHNTPDSLYGYNMIPALIAYLKGWIILKQHLPLNHWIHDYALDLAEGEPTISYHAAAEGMFYGRVDLLVKTYKKPITLSWQGHTVETSDVPVVFHDSQSYKCIALAPDVFLTDNLLLMADSYSYDEFELFDGQLEDDGNQLCLVIQSLNNTSPARLLETILNQGHFNLPNAKGSAVLVVTDDKGKRKVVNMTHVLAADFVGDMAHELQSLLTANAA